MKKNYPRSVKKFIRAEKARIRRQFYDKVKQEVAIKELYSKLSPKE